MNAEPVIVRRSGRRLAAVAAAAAAAASLILSGCAAGQRAQTASEKSTIDGTQADVGPLKLRGLSIETPSGNFYDVGSRLPVRLVVVNTGPQSDTLTSITSPTIGGWAAFKSTNDAAANRSASRLITVGSGLRISYGVPDARAVLVLTGLNKRVFPGNTIRLTFTFRRAGSVTATVPIQLSESPGTSVVPAPSVSAEG